MERISRQAGPRVGLPSVFAALSLLASTAAGQEAGDHGIRIARLIRNLGATEFDVRQEADRELVRLGAAASGPLRQALSSDDCEVRLRARHLLEAAEVNAIWAPRTVELQTPAVQASAALLDVAAQSGNHVHVGDPYGHFLDRELDVNWRQTTYWQALDDLCARTGNRLRPHYDLHTPGVVVSAGAGGSYPRAYGGPVRAQITRARRTFIEEMSYEDAKAELTHSFQFDVQFIWEDRFQLVGYASQPELVQAITDTQVNVRSAQSTSGGLNTASRGLRQVTATLKLNPVPVSARSFEVLKLKWALMAAGHATTLEISKPECDKVYTQDDVAVAVESLERQSDGKYGLSLCWMRDLAMPDPPEIACGEVEAELFDAQGRAFRLQSQSHNLAERGVLWKLTFAGESSDSEPGTLKIRYPRLRSRRELELTFRNVALPVAKPE